MSTSSSLPSSHDKVNLSRLVSRLEKYTDQALLKDKSYWEIRKLNEDAKYVRELLDRVVASDMNDSSNSTFTTYESKLNKLSMNLILAQPTNPPLPPPPEYTLSHPPTPTASSFTTDRTNSLSIPISAYRISSFLPEPSNSTPLPLASSSSPVVSPPIIVDAPHSTVPLSTPTEPEDPTRSSRDELLNIPWERIGLAKPAKKEEEGEGTGEQVIGRAAGISSSSSKVQDELTEQLAQMSAQLRKNAVYFSSSLEAEKPLLEQGAALLEANFSKLTGSQLRLGEVSTKGRSNTWLVLGACLVVCLAWLWMFVIIRMT